MSVFLYSLLNLSFPDSKNRSNLNFPPRGRGNIKKKKRKKIRKKVTKLELILKLFALSLHLDLPANLIFCMPHYHKVNPGTKLYSLDSSYSMEIRSPGYSIIAHKHLKWQGNIYRENIYFE